MWLALGEPRDAQLGWAVAGLRARGLAPFELVSVDELAGMRIRLSLSGEETGFWWRLRDGRVIESAVVRGVLNRLSTAPTRGLTALSEPDRAYAGREWYAALWGCLGSLRCPVLNPAATTGLCSARRSLARWAQLAARAGLAVRPYPGRGARAASVGVVWVAGERVVAPAELEAYGAACRRLAALGGTPLLAVHFGAAEDGVEVDGAWPLGPLRWGGEALLDALAVALGGPA